MIFGLKFYLEQPNLNFYNPIDATLDCGVSVLKIGKNLSNLKQMHKATIARSKLGSRDLDLCPRLCVTAPHQGFVVHHFVYNSMGIPRGVAQSKKEAYWVYNCPIKIWMNYAPKKVARHQKSN